MPKYRIVEERTQTRDLLAEAPNYDAAEQGRFLAVDVVTEWTTSSGSEDRVAIELVEGEEPEDPEDWP